MKVTYTPAYSPSLLGNIKAQYKQVSMELYVSNDGVCIDGMQSSHQGQGECQEMIDHIREDFKGKKLYGSPSLSPAVEHIFDKKGVVYAKGKGSILE